jgi:YVTN family beta-propeller protein
LVLHLNVSRHIAGGYSLAILGEALWVMSGPSSADRTVGFAILGPLRVTSGESDVALGGRQQRAILARLLIAGSTGASTEQLADMLWGERPPNGYATTIQTYVFHLRKALEPERGRGAPAQVLVTENGRYRLAFPPDSVDATQFQQAVDTGQRLLASGDVTGARVELRRGLGLWRGEVLADLADFEFVTPVAARLTEQRLAAIEAHIDCELAAGHHAAVIGELDELIAQYPLREQLHERRILALYRCGRQSEALSGYDRLRHQLADELGVDPSESLQRVHRQVLNHDPALDWTGPSEAPDREEVGGATGQSPRRPWYRRRSWLLGAGALVVAAAVAAVSLVIVSERPRSSLPALPANSVGVLSDNGSLHSAVPVGQSPSGIAYGAGSIWVANTSDGTVSRIDPHTQAVTQTIQVHAQPVAIAVTGQNIWVTNAGDGSVSQINANSPTEVERIPVGNVPAAIAAGPSGVWVANSGDNTIEHINPVTGATGPTVRVGAGPDGLAVDAHSVWVANGTARSVTQVNTDTNPPQTGNPILVGAGPAAIAITSTGVWVANQLDLTVDRIDPEKGRSVHVIDVGDGPSSILVAGSTVWVADEFDGTVTQIDDRTDHVRRRISVGAVPAGLALVGKTVWTATRAFAGAGHRGGTLTVFTRGMSSAVNNLDPNDANVTDIAEVVRSVYDGLVAFRPVSGSAGNTLVPDLATRLPTPTPDGLTYVFTLRKGIRYSDGSYIKASDFKRSIERALVLPHGDPSVFESVTGAKDCINRPGNPCDLTRGVVADDTAGTVTFHLSAPEPYFLDDLTLFDYAIPQNDSWAAELPTPPLGTGPYKIVNYIKGKGLTLVRNPYFKQWSFAAQPDGFPDVITWRPATNAHAVQSVLSGGGDVVELEDDAFGASTSSMLESLYRQHPNLLRSDPVPAADTEMFNTRVPPFNSVLARRAVNFATDRNELVQRTGGPQLANPTCQLLPPNFPGHLDYCPFGVSDSAGHYTGPEMTKAQQLVTQSGTRGQHVTVDVNAFDSKWIPRSEYFVGLLTTLGYKVTVRTVPPKPGPFGPLDFYRDPANRAQVFYALGWEGDFPSPDNFYTPRFSCSGSANFSGFCDPAIDRLASQARKLDVTDPADANQVWQQIDRRVTDASPDIFTTTFKADALISPRLRNYTRTPIGYLIFDQMSVQ